MELLMCMILICYDINFDAYTVYYQGDYVVEEIDVGCFQLDDCHTRYWVHEGVGDMKDNPKQWMHCFEEISHK